MASLGNIAEHSIFHSHITAMDKAESFRPLLAIHYRLAIPYTAVHSNIMASTITAPVIYKLPL